MNIRFGYHDVLSERQTSRAYRIHTLKSLSHLLRKVRPLTMRVHSRRYASLEQQFAMSRGLLPKPVAAKLQ